MALQFPPETELTSLVRDDAAWSKLEESLEPFVEPDCRFRWIAWEQPIERTGLDGLRSRWLDWFEPWESYRSEMREIVDAGDSIVVLGRDHARAPNTSAEVELRGAAVVFIRDGRVAGADFYADGDEALKAAGVAGRNSRTRP